MVRQVAFLRGINVGGHKKIKMADLRAMFEAIGFEDVKTLLASGNVVFEASEADSDVLARKIEEGIEASLGYQAGVIVRSVAEIQDMADSQPFEGIEVTSDTRLYVTFLPEEASHSLSIPYQSSEMDFQILNVVNKAIFSVLTLGPNSRTVDSMSILEKEFGKRITTRNWNTVNKVLGA